MELHAARCQLSWTLRQQSTQVGTKEKYFKWSMVPHSNSGSVQRSLEMSWCHKSSSSISTWCSCYCVCKIPGGNLFVDMCTALLSCCQAISAEFSCAYKQMGIFRSLSGSHGASSFRARSYAWVWWTCLGNQDDAVVVPSRTPRSLQVLLTHSS